MATGTIRKTIAIAAVTTAFVVGVIAFEKSFDETQFAGITQQTQLQIEETVRQVVADTQ